MKGPTGRTVVRVTRAALPEGAAGLTEPIGLTFFDTFFMRLPPHQRLFLYQTDRPLPSLVDALKASLSTVLPRFRSLAGKLTHVPATGDVVIAFAGDGRDGVDVVEAVLEGADFERLAAGDEAQDVEVLERLVPVTDVTELPAAVLTVQVTQLPSQGVAVGLSHHHVAIDGRALWQFMKAWTTKCKRLLNGGGEDDGGGGGDPEPIIDRSVIAHPGGGEKVARHYLELLTPNLPSLLNDRIAIPKDDGRRAARRTFNIPAAAVDSLKDRGAGSDGSRRPTTFVALAAHAWISVLRAKAVPADDLQPAALCFFPNCRNHLDPPVGDAYFGNCIKPCPVYATPAELLGDGGLGAACHAIEREMEACLEDPLEGCMGWLDKLIKLPRQRRVGVQAWPELRAYELADFGWGRPRRVELVSMSHDGDVALWAARDEEGGVQATVALSSPFMDSFASHFLGNKA